MKNDKYTVKQLAEALKEMPSAQFSQGFRPVFVDYVSPAIPSKYTELDMVLTIDSLKELYEKAKK